MDSIKFNLSNYPMFTGLSRNDSGIDITSLVKRRTSTQDKSEKNPFESNIEINNHSPEDIKELEDYCKKRGIVGVNFGNMNPRAILSMLKGKEIPQESKKQLLKD